MGCGSCGVSSSSNKTGGCSSGGCSSGGCSSGGCNRFNVFDWLSDIPASDFGKTYGIIEASFNNGSRKEFFQNDKELLLEKGNYITVEGINGFDVGVISLTGELVKLQMKKHSIKEEDVIKKVLRTSNESDLETFENNKSKEKEYLVRARSIARSQNLEMKIGEVEVQADGKKLSIYYTANNRVDFRELIKIYAQEFNSRIEMRQIGSRQESGKVGGIGSCGRELCCSTWLTDFKTVYTSAARYQNLSINQTKLSGQCGKLKCCLNYELDTYMDVLTNFPNQAEVLHVQSGRIKLIKKDVFKGIMWYVLEDKNKHYPLSIERVKEIQSLNANNIFPDEIKPMEIESNSDKKIGVSVDAGFVNDVGQITLNSLNKKKKKNNRNKDSRDNKDNREIKDNRIIKDNSVEKNIPRENRPLRDKNNDTIRKNKKQQPNHSNQGNANIQQNVSPNVVNKNKDKERGEKVKNSNVNNNTNNNNKKPFSPNDNKPHLNSKKNRSNKPKPNNNTSS